MSSEMRELIRKEVEQWVGITRNRDIERSARVWMEGYDAALTYCAERISALLARTEAGADGAVGYVSSDGNAVWLTDGSFSLKPSAGTNLFTRPHYASGDAEVLTAHGIKALDRCCGELRKFIELAGDYDLDEMSVQALETAIESMEMRKAAAMQAKEAK